MGGREKEEDKIRINLTNLYGNHTFLLLLPAIADCSVLSVLVLYIREAPELGHKKTQQPPVPHPQFI